MDFNRIIIGCDQLGGSDWGKTNITDVMNAIKYAYECGIKRFDTADVYGLGLSEARLNTLFFEKRDLRVTTKVGVRWLMSSDWERAKTFRDDDQNYLKIALENSLQRLESLTVDNILLHWPTNKNNLKSALDLFKSYKEGGKVNNYGFCNGEKFVDEILNAPENRNKYIYQTNFNLTFKNEKYLENLSKKFNSIQLYGIYAQGILATKDFDFKKIVSNDRRSRLGFYKKGNINILNNLSKELSLISDSYNVPLASLILYCTMKSLPFADIIIGIRNRNHVESILKAFELKITNKEFTYIKKLFHNLNLEI